MGVFKAGGRKKEKISNRQQTDCCVKHDKSLLFILSYVILTRFLKYILGIEDLRQERKSK